MPMVPLKNPVQPLKETLLLVLVRKSAVTRTTSGMTQNNRRKTVRGRVKQLRWGCSSRSTPTGDIGSGRVPG